jgi:hypothetical protein
MRTSTHRILREALLIEKELDSMEIHGALLEVMQNQALASIIIAEERKILRYALQTGAVDREQLNEGLFADITLGLGQAVGSLPGLAQLGVGSAFGAAGVLYYGSKIFSSSGFDFYMNVLFCLFSAAAIEPSGIFGEAGALGKLMKPFVTLGEWARGLGSSIAAGAAEAFKGLSAINKTIVQGAVQAEGPLLKGLTFVETKIVPNITKIFNAIKGQIAKLPGSGTFTKIVEKVAAAAPTAVTEVKAAITSLIEFGKNALGVAGRQGVEAVAKFAPAQIEKLLATVPKFAYTTAGGASKQVGLTLSKDGMLMLTGLGKGAGKSTLISAAELPNVVAQIAKTAGSSAAEAALTAARSAPNRAYAAALNAAGKAAGLSTATA